MGNNAKENDEIEKKIEKNIALSIQIVIILADEIINFHLQTR